jgi:rhamnosyltransferase
MSTYNGEQYLRTQLDSILSQTNVSIDILVRDDGSSDNTIQILKEYSKKGKIRWYSGKNLRSSKSFIDLIFNSADADYYAFCDQDDFWLPEKMSKAIEKMEKLNPHKPQLYFSVAKLVDSELKPISKKALSYGVVNFSEAIVTSNATGCTMCFNKILRDKIKMHRPVCEIMHDGWVHKLCLAISGDVYFDKESYILYRQHGNNVVGGQISFVQRWKRRWKNLTKMQKIRSSAIKEIFDYYKKDILPENQELCKIVAEYDESLFKRIQLMLCRKIKCKRLSVDFYYRLAVLLGIF